jgi:sugar phosphate isomerase/epimerase
MHPRVAVSAVSTWEWSFNDDLAFWREAGITNVGLAVRKLSGVPSLHPSFVVSSVGTVGYFALDQPSTWEPNRQSLTNAIEVATAVGAPCVVVVSGPAGRLEWDDAANALSEALAPGAKRAADAGVSLALENTTSLRTDYSFVHRLLDAVDLATMLGIGVCMEIQSCWSERGLSRTVAQHIGTIRLVQISDFVIGTNATPDRAVLGDGDIPLDRIVGQLLDAGYTGMFEIELIGPRIDKGGYRDAVLRSVAYLDGLLVRLLER